jgi:hypothetical protein
MGRRKQKSRLKGGWVCILGVMPKPREGIHIPLSTDKALIGLLRVKPTTSMPRPGAQPTKAKKTARKKAATARKGP